MNIKIITAGMVAVATLTVPAATAHADTSATCTSKIVDDTTKHVLDMRVVESAVEDIEHELGVDVYVRAFQHTPNGDAAGWFRSAVAECSSWRGVDPDEPKPNLLVVEFGMDHTSAIAYGGNLDHLKTSIDGIRAKSINGNLRKGKFTRAVTDSLNAVKSASLTSTNTGFPGSEPLTPLRDSKGPEISAGDFVLFITKFIIFPALLIAAGWLSVLGFRRRKETVAELKEAQARLDKAKVAAGEAVLADVAGIHTRLDAAVFAMPAKHRDGYAKKVTEHIDAILIASGECADILSQPDVAPRVRNRKDIASRAVAVEDAAAALRSAHRDAEEMISKVKEYVDSLSPEAVAKVRQTIRHELDLVNTMLSDTHSLGFTVSKNSSELAALTSHEKGLDDIAEAVDRRDTAHGLWDDVKNLAEIVRRQNTAAHKLDEMISTLVDSVWGFRGRVLNLKHISSVNKEAYLSELDDYSRAAEKFVSNKARKGGKNDPCADLDVADNLLKSAEGVFAKAQRADRSANRARNSSSYGGGRGGFSDGLIIGSVLSGDHSPRTSGGGTSSGSSGGSFGGWGGGSSGGGSFGGW